MKHPKVSICIPAYNQPDSVERLLSSIREQTFLDYEIVITDDSTTNAVSDIVSRFKDMPNLRYQKNKETKGLAANWNASIDLATGDYIKIMHHDDWFSSRDSLSGYVSMLDKHTGADFAFSATDAFDEYQRFRFRHSPSINQIDQLKTDAQLLFKGNFIGAPSATIFRRVAAVRFDKNLRWLVDIDFYIRLLRENKKFVFSPKPLTCITTGSPRQVTAECQNNRCIELREYFYVYQKIRNGLSDVFKYWTVFWTLVKRTRVISTNDILVCGEELSIPIWVRAMIIFRAVFAIAFLEQGVRVLRRIVWRIIAKIQRAWHWKKSYSQCGEDVIIEFIFSWIGIHRPVYMDIGAHHPTYLSNTYRLYRAGSFGVSIEPDPTLCRRIKQVRKREVALNVGVGIGTEERTAKFYIMSTRTLNTFSKVEAERYQSYGNQNIESIVDIPLLSVNEIIEEYCKTTPNLVSLDVEGFDLPILQSFDFCRYRPEVFCIETLTFTENNTEEKLNEIISFMESKNYFVYADTYINTIFVDKVVWDARTHD